MNNYSIISKIGEGAYGKIYSVTKNNKIYTLKKASIELGVFEDYKSSLKNGNINTNLLYLKDIPEIKYLSRLNSDNGEYVPKLIEYGFTGKYEYSSIIKCESMVEYYIIYQYTDTSLFNYLSKRKDDPLSNIEIKYLLYKLLKGIEYIHSKNIIQCDIKSPNILVSNDLVEVKYIDFGISEHFNRKDLINIMYERYTIWYRPPEVNILNVITTKSDIWALACVFYEIITGKVLFPANTNLDLVYKQIKYLGINDIENWPYKYQFEPTDSVFGNNVSKIAFEDKELEELISDMLTLDYKLRPSATELLRYDYFNGM